MSDTHTLPGIHHITAISSTPRVNVSFYENVLGLRLVKQTVNFDDPYTYHLYYGDQGGRPGTILTFFPWEGIPQGEVGTGMVTGVAFQIGSNSSDYWLERLAKHNVETAQEERFGDKVITFEDPHGLSLELVATQNSDRPVAESSGLPEERHRIKGFHSATALVRSEDASARLLTEVLGLRLEAREAARVRFAMNNDEGTGSYYDLLVDPGAPVARQGSGTVHHIAFRARSEAELLGWQQHLRKVGSPVTEVRDRKYFKSIYFHEPSGVLFEIASDPPGFAVDEPVESLGRSLMLPDQYEPMRDKIEQQLPPLRSTDFVHQFVGAGENNDKEVTLVALHGTGGNEKDLIPLARLVSENSAVISPRGQVNEHGLHRFFKRLAPGVFDEEDILVRAEGLGDFLKEAAVRYERSPDHLVALGYSNGANIAAALLFTRPELFSRAILLRPMLPLSQRKPAKMEGKHILILRGTKDRVIPAESTDRLIDLLNEAGAQVTVVDIEAGHELTEIDVESSRRWLAETSPLAVTQ